MEKSNGKVLQILTACPARNNQMEKLNTDLNSLSCMEQSNGKVIQILTVCPAWKNLMDKYYRS